LLTVYAATAHGGPNRTKVWRVVGTGVGGFTAVALLGVLSPSEDLPAAAVIGISIVHVTAAVTGEIIYDRRRRLFEFEQRAIRAENERLLMARQAVLDERATIARDLHDVVAHGMSVMIVQAGAAERMLNRDPDAATEALRHIQAAGREALSEMRRMLAVLRDEHSSSVELSPQPTMSDLEQVVRRCSDAGVPTELVTEGEMPAGAVGESMAAYRVAQEALTNVIKHAGSSARAIVKVQYRPDRIVVEVLDTGAGASDAMLRASTGHGFVGMRERVDLYGGTLRFGPRPGGGFRVVATIPLTRAAASPRFEVAR
jgi:signal transduction histidine kinase